MTDNPLSGKVSLDTTDYKAGVSELNRQIRVIESGFRASAASMDHWDKTAEGLELRNKALSSEMELQKRKVTALTSEYKKVVAEKGADSRAAQDLQIKINRETEALNKSEQELRQNEKALVSVKNDTKNLGNEQEKTERKTISLKNALGGLGKALAAVGKAVAAVAAAALAAVGALAGLIFKSASLADEMEETAQKTGLTVEQLQELTYIGKQVGSEADTVIKAMARLTRGMGDAQQGTGEVGDVFEKLGVKYQDASGALRDNEDVFADALAALREWPNETERDAMAMELFGKSAQELNPLIETSTEDLKKMTDEAHRVGAVMSDRAVSGLAKLNDTMAGVKSGLQGIAGELAATFAPMVQNSLNGVMGYLTRFSNIAKESFGKTGGSAAYMATGFSNIFKDIIKDVAGKAPEMVRGGLGFLQGLIDAIVTVMPEIIKAVMEIVTEIVGFLGTSIPTLITALMPMLFKLIYGLLGMLPQLLSAVMQILVALMKGITAQLPVLIPMLVEILIQMVNVLIENLPIILNAAMQLVLGLVQGIIAALPVLIEALPVLIETIVMTLIENVPMLLLAAVQIILALVFGIIENIPLLLAAIPKLIKALVDRFKSPEFKTQMKEMGKSLIDGLKQGWEDAWTKFKENISKGFKELVKWIKALLGIASPAKIMTPIGFSLPAGIGVGWLESFKNLKRLVSDSMLDLTNISAGFGGLTNNLAIKGAGGQFSTQSESYQFFGPVLLQGATGQSLGETIKARRY